MTPEQKPLLARLREQLQRIERGRAPVGPGLGTGCSALDRLLPAGGFLPGQLVEWLGEEGAGVQTLALVAAREVARRGGGLVVFDRRGEFYVPAAAALGVDLESLLIVRSDTLRERLWALDQVLRCRATGAVWAPLGRLSRRWFRRFQLAAEEGQTVGMLVRSKSFLGQPSWAALQLLVEPGVVSEREGQFAPGSPSLIWRVTITRCRSGTAGKRLWITLDEASGVLREVVDETGAVRLAARLGDSTPADCPT